MKKKNLFLLIFPTTAVVLAALPYGAVLNFANPDGENFRKTFSYFDLTPFGYANFGPFITAVLTMGLFALAFAYFVFNKRKIVAASAIIAAVAVLSSLTPLMYGTKAFSFVGLMISLSLVFHLVLSIVFLKNSSKEHKNEE